MSEPLRIAALAGTLFTVSYGGAAWVMAGTPTFGTQPHQPKTQIVALATPQLRGTQPALPSGDGHPDRDPVRIAALEASNIYARNPCNTIAKAAMVQTVTVYAKAWADLMGCGPDGCDYRKINSTAAVFSTPLDVELRNAIGAAFERGISIEDFPATLRMNVAMLVRGRGSQATACPQNAQFMR